MANVVRGAGGWLDARTLERLGRRLEQALRRARGSGGPTLASVTALCPAATDPTAVVVRSRRADERWFVLEQPDRAGSALAALGCIREMGARGGARFGEVAARWRVTARHALADPVGGVPGSGLVAVGGFAFSAEGGDSPRWSGFPAASLVVPEVSFARRSGETWITLNCEVAPDDTLGDLLERVHRRLDSLSPGPLPLFDPSPAAPTG